MCSEPSQTQLSSVLDIWEYLRWSVHGDDEALWSQLFLVFLLLVRTVASFEGLPESQEPRVKLNLGIKYRVTAPFHAGSD